MKNVQIKAICASNFKGANFTFEPNGVSADIFGDNATGKTTVADAIHWVLFDKDSKNKKDFAIKTLNDDGTEQHNGEHTASLTLIVDSAEIALKKTFREKWTKKRGSAEKEFTGHETKYWVDDVPATKKDYTAKVAEIIDEGTFKLLTNPLYFSEEMKWDERRQLLMQLENVTDEDVTAAAPELAELLFALQGKSFDDYKKVVAEKKKLINAEIKEIPPRISELQGQLSYAGDTAPKKARITEIEQEIDALNEQMAAIKNGGAIAQKKAEINDIRAKALELKSNFQLAANDATNALRTRVQEEESNLFIMQRKHRDIENAIETEKAKLPAIAEKIASLEAEKAEKITEYRALKALEFTFEDACTCPTCKQELPAEQVEAARTTALEAFNLDKSEKLAKNIHVGKQIAGEIGTLQVQQQDTNLKIGDLEADKERSLKDIEKKQQQLEKFVSDLKKAESETANVEDDEQYKALIAKGIALDAEIKQLEEHAQDALTGVQEQKQQLIAERNQLNSEVAKTANADAINARIEELEQNERDLAAQYEKIEMQLFQIEEFMRVKCELLEEKVNSHFKLVTFKLFDQQVNGALVETCEVLVNGVPFSSGLNNAARINAGIDIINTISKRYGITAPLVIDNAEAVTKVIDTDAQVIRLIVSAADKVLRMVTKTTQEVI